jgi:hypothetical protein
MKPTLKAPGSKRLKLKCDEPLSKFAGKIKLRRYTKVTTKELPVWWLPDVHDLGLVAGRGSHSFPFPHNLSSRCPFCST